METLKNFYEQGIDTITRMSNQPTDQNMQEGHKLFCHIEAKVIKCTKNTPLDGNTIVNQFITTTLISVTALACINALATVLTSSLILGALFAVTGGIVLHNTVPKVDQDAQEVVRNSSLYLPVMGFTGLVTASVVLNLIPLIAIIGTAGCATYYAYNIEAKSDERTEATKKLENMLTHCSRIPSLARLHQFLMHNLLDLDKAFKLSQDASVESSDDDSDGENASPTDADRFVSIIGTAIITIKEQVNPREPYMTTEFSKKASEQIISSITYFLSAAEGVETHETIQDLLQETTGRIHAMLEHLEGHTETSLRAAAHMHGLAAIRRAGGSSGGIHDHPTSFGGGGGMHGSGGGLGFGGAPHMHRAGSGGGGPHNDGLHQAVSDTRISENLRSFAADSH